MEGGRSSSIQLAGWTVALRRWLEGPFLSVEGGPESGTESLQTSGERGLAAESTSPCAATPPQLRWRFVVVGPRAVRSRQRDWTDLPEE